MPGLKHDKTKLQFLLLLSIFIWGFCCLGGLFFGVVGFGVVWFGCFLVWVFFFRRSNHIAVLKTKDAVFVVVNNLVLQMQTKAK